MRVCDYIAEYLYSLGVRRVYGLMGGGASGLNDGFIKHGKLQYVCHHHEQGAGYAAYGEAKFTNRISVVNPTTGCGGTNTLTPVLNAYQDAVPMLVLSGNVRLSHTTNYLNRTRGVQLRKYGVQEHDIVNTVKNITKLAEVVESPDTVAFQLGKACYLAQNQRAGPVWLDIPSDVQTADMPLNPKLFEPTARDYGSESYNAVVELLEQSRRPCVIAGNGIHVSNTRVSFERFVHYYNLPVVTSYLGRDLLPADDQHMIGTIGIKGSRAANFVMHHADLLIILGCSMNATHVGYDEKQFSPNSKRIMIDCDYNEYCKGTVHIDRIYTVDLNSFFREFEHEQKHQHAG